MAYWHSSVGGGVVQLGHLYNSSLLGNVRLGHSSVGVGVVQLGHLHSSTLFGNARLGLSPRVGPWQEMIMLVTGLYQELHGTQHTWPSPSV